MKQGELLFDESNDDKNAYLIAYGKLLIWT